MSRICGNNKNSNTYNAKRKKTSNTHNIKRKKTSNTHYIEKNTNEICISKESMNSHYGTNKANEQHNMATKSINTNEIRTQYCNKVPVNPE